MPLDRQRLLAEVSGIDALLVALPPSPAAARARADLAALLHHLLDRRASPPVIVILGGTGAGKSTLLNRLLAADLTAASFRRTHTAGPVAAVASLSQIPPTLLAVPHQPADSLPARGQLDTLTLLQHDHPLLRPITLIDTPDVDGDIQAHHAQAHRAFQWASGVLFLVTPEKYQMTELAAYYRLARRYRLPAWYVMNKCETDAPPADWARQLNLPNDATPVYCIPRDDAPWSPPAGRDQPALAEALASAKHASDSDADAGLAARAADLAARITDQVVAPMEESRRNADRAAASLQSLISPESGVDVSPVVKQLQRRMQQKSVLYLIGPGRVIDRARQLPGFLMRLPRTAFDAIARGKLPASTEPDSPRTSGNGLPDYPAILADQFSAFTSRVDDTLRSTPAVRHWIESDPAAYAAAILPASEAAAIADRELADLGRWLADKWHATPRDTAILQKLISYLPGGKQLTKLSEAAPYLLTVIVAAHHAFLGPVDLLIIGGYALATWLGERVSNEVSAKAKATNKRIAAAYDQLATQQIHQVTQWLQSQAPPNTQITTLSTAAQSIATLATP